MKKCNYNDIDQKIFEILINAVKELLEENDFQKFFENEVGKNEVGEWSISFRLGLYMDKAFAKLNNENTNKKFTDAVVDGEYNRNIAEPKTCGAHCTKDCKYKEKSEEIEKAYQNGERGCRPDIILHHRGDHRNNLLVVEVKKQSNKQQADRDIDAAKLTYFTCPNSEYKYKLGAFVDVGVDNAEITLYKKGKPVGKGKFSCQTLSPLDNGNLNRSNVFQCIDLKSQHGWSEVVKKPV